MSTFDELSSPVPVSEGSQVSGEEVGPASGVVAGSNLAATGAGNGPGGVVPVPVAAQPESGLAAVLSVIEKPECWCEYVDIGVGMQRVTDEPDCPCHSAFGLASAVIGKLVLLGWGPSSVPVDDANEPAWGSGPLVDHNPETPAPATCDTCDGKGVIACYGSYPGGPTACIDCHNTGEMPCPDCPGTGSADPDGWVVMGRPDGPSIAS